MAEQVTAIKSTVEYMNRTYKVFWNGKVYGTKCYVTISSEGGSEYKVSFDAKRGTVEQGKIGFALLNCAALRIEADLVLAASLGGNRHIAFRAVDLAIPETFIGPIHVF